jgi:hypothetical protein
MVALAAGKVRGPDDRGHPIDQIAAPPSRTPGCGRRHVGRSSIAVVLDFVDPLRPFRDLMAERREVWRAMKPDASSLRMGE